MPPHRSLDQFFQRINEIKPISWAVHPSDRTLRDFSKNQLKTSWTPSTEHFEKILNGTLEDWTGTDVRAHVLTCERCAGQLRRLRRPTGEFIAWLDAIARHAPNWVFEPAIFRVHGLTYVAATIALFILPFVLVDNPARSHSPLIFLSQLFQGSPIFSWLGLILLVIWGAWSLIALFHFLLLRHKGLW